MASVLDRDALSRIAFAAVWRGVSLPLRIAEARTGWTGARLASAIDQLRQVGRLELDGSGIIGAHGVTLRSTAHCVLHDGLETHTWCAFDAIGIPAALGVDAIVVSSCPACRRQLEVVAHAGVFANGPFLIWIPSGPCKNVMRDFCLAANLFCSREHVEDWRRTSGMPEGEALTLVGVAEHGRQAWADVASSVHEFEDR